MSTNAIINGKGKGVNFYDISRFRSSEILLTACPHFHKLKIDFRRLYTVFFSHIRKKMEYKILGIDENDPLDIAQKAMKKIRIKYHPDKLLSLPHVEQEKNKSFLILAEEAFEHVRNKHAVRNAMQSATPFTNYMGSIFQDFDSCIDQMHRMQSHMQETPNASNTYTSVYKYQNMNGKETESGRVNHRPMSDEELKQYRPSIGESIFGSIR